MDDALLVDGGRDSATVFEPAARSSSRKSAFSAMASLQRVFFAKYNKRWATPTSAPAAPPSPPQLSAGRGERRKVKLIVGTVGVQVFDLKRKLLVTLHIKEMPEWTIGKTLRDTDKGTPLSPRPLAQVALGR